MTNFHAFLEEQKKDKKFKEEYDALEPEFSVMQAMLDKKKPLKLEFVPTTTNR